MTKLRLAAVVLAFIAKSVFAFEPVFDEEYHEISSSSEIGKTLLSSARALEDGNYDISFLADYSIKYQGCGDNNNNTSVPVSSQNGFIPMISFPPQAQAIKGNVGVGGGSTVK